MTNPDLNILIIKPDGSYTGLHSDDAQATASHFCGGFIERLPEAFHGLRHYEVWHADDYTGLEVNTVASQLAGMDLAQHAPMRGTVILARLPDGQNQDAERAHQLKFFGIEEGDQVIQAHEDLVDYYLHRRDELSPAFRYPEEELEREELEQTPASFMDALLQALFDVRSGKVDFVVVEGPGDAA